MRIAIAAILGASLAAPSLTHAQISSDLHHFLQAQFGDPHDHGNTDITCRTVPVHLNGTGEQYIVYLSGPDICGSGGCGIDIIERRGNSFHIITETAITRMPFVS